MKIQPMKQIADHDVRYRPVLSGLLAVIDEEIEALKWKLWHGQVERAISALDCMGADMDHLGQNGDLSAARLYSFSQQLLTYIRSNRTAIAYYGARYQSGRRIAKSLAESAVNFLVAKRMVKHQQMRWSQRGARSSHAAGQSRHDQWQYMGTASRAAEYVDFIYFNLLASHDLAAQIERNLSTFPKTSDMTAPPFFRALTVFDPLLARTALVVERHDILGGWVMLVTTKQTCG
jgi:hypothetical protein